MDVKKGRWAILFAFFVTALIVFCLFASCVVGSADLSLRAVCEVLFLKVRGKEIPKEYNTITNIVWELRLPRALGALGIGGGLAVAGAAMQAVTQNVMADPYTLGVSSGALAAVSAGTAIGGAFASSSVALPLLAFSGAMLSMLLVYAIGGVGRAANTTKLILSGMAVSITLNAVSQYFIVTSDNDIRVRGILSWMMGSFANIRWDNLAIPFLGIILGCTYFILRARAFDLMALGAETAISLGTNVRSERRIALPVVSFVTGLAVAGGGLIGLVGFMIPHIVRFIVGTNHRKLFPIAFLSGGLFMIIMDMIARTIAAPQEVPIGIFTALCGGPFFIWLLKKRYGGR